MKSAIQFKNSISNSVAVLVFSLSVVFSANVLADSSTSNSVDLSFSENSKNYDTKAKIKLEKMNNKHKKAEKDNRIGAFSMVDGAMEGYYGDGEYAE